LTDVQITVYCDHRSALHIHQVIHPGRDAVGPGAQPFTLCAVNQVQGGRQILTGTRVQVFDV